MKTRYFPSFTISLRLSFFLMCCSICVSAEIADCSVLEVESLRCEYQDNPLGIDVTVPRLSWILKSETRGQKQTAYQVIVSTCLEDLQGDQWDSQKVVSRNSVQVDYRGRALSSATRYYWKVRVWDKDGHPSDWSQPSWFETALLDQADWDAEWINDGKSNPVADNDYYKLDPAPLFRKGFDLDKPVKQAMRLIEDC